MQDGNLIDNAHGFVTRPCEGCKKWAQQNIHQVESDVQKEEERIPEENRVRLLTQLIVDRSRLKGGDKNYVVANCEPFGS